MMQMWDVRTFSCTGTLTVNNEVFGLGTAAGHLFSGDENGTIKVIRQESKARTTVS